MTAAVQWVSQITAIAVEIVVCIWLGRWLDDRFGTRFLTPLGLVVGPVLGFWHLLTLTGVIGRSNDTTDRPHDPQP